MKKRLDLIEQERHGKIFTIVELYYRSQTSFRQQYDRYEERVLHYSRELGRDRGELRLGAEELGGLLDLKAVERLRDEYLWSLKDLCHRLFRGKDHTDLLDRYVSDIFHEISILKEEHYNVQTYAPQYARDEAEVELKYILDEAHGMFPQKLNQILFLFGKAQARMEELLGRFRGFKIFIRSLFNHRDGFVREAYDDGIRQFYRHMYPEGGPVEGFYEVGLSFLESGFYAQALEALRLAQAEYAGDRTKTPRVQEMMTRTSEKIQEVEGMLEGRGLAETGRLRKEGKAVS